MKPSLQSAALIAGFVVAGCATLDALLRYSGGRASFFGRDGLVPGTRRAERFRFDLR